MDPRERLEQLCDAGSLQSIRTAVRSRHKGVEPSDGDGVLGASATIDGRPVFCYAQDQHVAGGSLGEAHANTIIRVLALADRAAVPVIAFVESAGARIQEATAALSAYASIFRQTVALSGHVPQISIVSGLSAGGGAYAPALTDFTVMLDSASMFLTGPSVVRAALGEDSTALELGGAAVHARNGVSHFVASSPADAASITRGLLSYLPQNSRAPTPRHSTAPPPPGDPGEHVPPETRRVYDMRPVIRAIVDAGEILEVSADWARNMITAFARIDGRSVGIIANQPKYKGGTIDSDGARKGARFVRTCDTFGVPLVVLVDTPGFLPGRTQEQRGVIRSGAELLHAFAAASVPRVTVIVRQAYGGAYITMNARDLGADFVFAWPNAQIGIMSAQHAVDIIHRRDIAISPDPQQRASVLAQRYETARQTARAAAEQGFVDEVITPAHTRERLVSALSLLAKPPAVGR